MHNHSRPWEKLPQAVLNLLDLYSLYAYWDNVESVWRVKPARRDDPGLSVPDNAPLEIWIAAVRVVEKRYA